MPSVTRPSAIPFWTDGGTTKVAQPPAAKIASGWTAGEPPIAQYMNWLSYQAGLWISYLDSQQNASAMSDLAGASIRLAGGGVWSWNLSTQTLSWSLPFYLLVPGVADATNACPAGSVTLASGAVAYVAANIPFTTQGDISSGSTTVLNLDYQSGIVAGAAVTGTGIAPGTSVVDVGSGQLTLSNAATSTVSQQSLTFANAGALNILSVAESSLELSANTVIIARALVATVILGVGGGHTILRHGEAKALFDTGYLSVLQATAGVALTVGQPVYLSIGSADASRTAGAAYPLDASAANGAMRTGFAGVVYSAAAAGTSCGIVTAGALNAYTGLVIGQAYYADPATPGGITTPQPVTTGAYSVPVGIAVSATGLSLNPALSATASIIQSQTAWPNYAAATEAQLATALAAANAYGGVIVLTGNFSISASHTIGNRVVIQGRKGASIVTVLAGGTLVMSGDGAEIRDVKFMTGAAVNILAVSGSRNVIMSCSFTLLGSNCCGVYVTGCSNRLKYVALGGTGQSATAVGIWYATGSTDNIDSDTFVVS